MRLALETTPDPMERLKKRGQFLTTARGERWVSDAFVLQARRRPDDERAAPPRAGFTASRKVGNAVERNRARRRLKEAARRMLDHTGVPGHDYVLVARRGALAHPFADILADLEIAVKRVHRKLDRKSTAQMNRPTDKRGAHDDPGGAARAPTSHTTDKVQ